MITGQPLNHRDTITLLLNNISQYKISINGKPYDEYIQTLNDNDFKKVVILQTLCNETDRNNSQQLLRILFPHSKLLPAEALLEAGDNINPESRHLWNELQLCARRAVPRGFRQRSGASVRQRRRTARRVQSPT